MTDDYTKELIKNLEIRRMRTALESVPETEDSPGYENKPVLVRVVVPGKHKLIHPVNFIEKLQEEEQLIDPVTLEIFGIEELPTKEDFAKWGITEEMLAAKKAEATGESTPPAEVPAAPAPTPPPTVVWSEKELKTIGDQKKGYDKLRAISKLYKDIPGNISKAALIEKISGRPKP